MSVELCLKQGTSDIIPVNLSQERIKDLLCEKLRKKEIKTTFYNKSIGDIVMELFEHVKEEKTGPPCIFFYDLFSSKWMEVPMTHVGDNMPEVELPHHVSFETLAKQEFRYVSKHLFDKSFEVNDVVKPFSKIEKTPLPIMFTQHSLGDRPKKYLIANLVSGLMYDYDATQVEDIGTSDQKNLQVVHMATNEEDGTNRSFRMYYYKGTFWIVEQYDQLYAIDLDSVKNEEASSGTIDDVVGGLGAVLQMILYIPFSASGGTPSKNGGAPTKSQKMVTKTKTRVYFGYAHKQGKEAFGLDSIKLMQLSNNGKTPTWIEADMKSFVRSIQTSKDDNLETIVPLKVA